MTSSWALLIAVAALAIGGMIGWLIGARSQAGLRVERDLHLDNFRKAIVDLETASHDREAARVAIGRLEAERDAFDREAMTSQFAEIGNRLLVEAQKSFLERADQRFKQSEELSGKALQSLISPMHERLEK